MRLDNIDTYFLTIAEVVAKRSPCLRRQVGAIIVKDKSILGTGYNGVPVSFPHCTSCAREGLKSGQGLEHCLAVHSEVNAIVQAAKHGVCINGATLYCTNLPCMDCAKVIANSGIVRVVYKEYYPAEKTEMIFRFAGIELCQNP